MNVPTNPAERRQWYLDESLRIAVWEVLFGTGPHARVTELLAQGACWKSEDAVHHVVAEAEERAA